MSNLCGTVEVLDQACCVALLATTGVGRVVFTQRAMPALRPVEFVISNSAIWFAGGPAETWIMDVLDTVVAFSADNMATDEPVGWYVTVVGRAVQVRNRPLPEGWRCVRLPIETAVGHRVLPHS